VAAVAEEGVVEAGDLGIGNVVHASFQILHSEIHALNVMAQKVVVAAVAEEAAMATVVAEDMAAVVVADLVAEDTDEETVLDHLQEVAVAAVHADLVIGFVHNVNFLISPPENAALNVQLLKTLHSDNQRVLSPAMRKCQRASLTGQHFVVRRMITLCPLQQHLAATRGHVRADDHTLGRGITIITL